MKKFRWMFLLLSTVLFLTGCSGKTLRVGVFEQDWPPLYQQSESESNGFDAALAQMLAEKMGYGKVSFVRLSLEERETALSDKRVDLLMGGLLEEQVVADATTTKPYLKIPQVAVTLDGSVNDLKDCADKQIAVLFGSGAYYAMGLDQNFRHTLAGWTAYNRIEDLFAALDEGKVDVVLCDRPVAEAVNTGNERQISESLASLSYVIACRDTDSGVISKLNEALMGLSKDGTGAALSQEYLLADYFVYS